eukprot:5186526-Amphidinium_carterae.2
MPVRSACERDVIQRDVIRRHCIKVSKVLTPRQSMVESDRLLIYQQYSPKPFELRKTCPPPNHMVGNCPPWTAKCIQRKFAMSTASIEVSLSIEGTAASTCGAVVVVVLVAK